MLNNKKVSDVHELLEPLADILGMEIDADVTISPLSHNIRGVRMVKWRVIAGNDMLFRPVILHSFVYLGISSSLVCLVKVLGDLYLQFVVEKDKSNIIRCTMFILNIPNSELDNATVLKTGDLWSRYKLYKALIPIMSEMYVANMYELTDATWVKVPDAKNKLRKYVKSREGRKGSYYALEKSGLDEYISIKEDFRL